MALRALLRVTAKMPNCYVVRKKTIFFARRPAKLPNIIDESTIQQSDCQGNSNIHSQLPKLDIMSSSVQPSEKCYLLSIPPELRLIIYEHYFSFACTEISSTRTWQDLRSIMEFSERAIEQSRPLFTSHQMLLEAHPIYDSNLQRQAPKCRTAIAKWHGTVKYLHVQSMSPGFSSSTDMQCD